MRLSSLEIHGFKSFADKTVINFNKNITGVVGPNGCGKSNVIDSIRWVLGEQRTKNLRSDKMDNLIFNGTKMRKSANRATVVLTFENDRNLLPSEFTTVAVSRTLYRTGESEYKINNVNCRLKDISALFMDTGISSDSYAIIELSMINDILADKENVRRKLFEQASGITKYKKRKHETFNKLKATEADLERVEDLLAEIESNLTSLEKQAKRAAKYNKIKGQYKDFSLNLATSKLSKYKGVFEELKNNTETEIANKSNLEERVAALEQKILDSKSLSSEKEIELNEAQIALNNHIDKLRFEENNKGLMNEKIKFLIEKKRNLISGLEEDQNSVTRLKAELLELEEKVVEEEAKLQETLNELNSAKDENSEIKVQFMQKKEHLNKLEEELREFELKYFALEKEIAVNKNDKENLLREIGQSKLQFESKQQELEVLKKEKESSESQNASLKKEWEGLNELQESNKKKISSLEQNLEKVREEFIVVNRDLDSKRNEFDLTKSLIDNLEGFSNATKFLKNNKDWQNKGLLVSDVFDCKDEYKVAIENYLSPVLEHYIVEDLNQADTAISLLKGAEKGKASFFLLKEIDGQSKPASKIEGYTIASELVKVDKKYLNLANHLLKNVYVTDGDADSFPFNKFTDAIVLSKTGDIIRSSGKIVGGSVGAFEGKTIGRIQNMEQLEKDIVSLNEKSSKYSGEINELKSDLDVLKKSQLPKDLANKQNQINQLQNKLASCDARIQNYENFLEENSDKFTVINQKLQTIDNALDGFQADLNIASSEMENQKNITNDYRNSYVNSESQLSESSEHYNRLNLKFYQQQNLLGSIQQKIQFKNNNISELNSKTDINKQLLENTDGEIEGIEGSIRNSDGDIGGLYEEKDELEAAVQNIEKEYHTVRNQIEEIDQEVKQIQKNKENTDQLISSLKDKKNEFDMNLLSIKERLKIEFGIEIQEVMEMEVDAKLNLEELEPKVERLKKRIENFGEVNPFAEEAYNEMKERFDFITEQKNDLHEAQKNLVETINEIEQSATEKFMEAFNKVKDNFKYVFKRLFSEEDVCDLFLTDPDNPLESKVEITAKPKGKRPLTINQLSGGEKALTSISLIFSLYLLKPAPFCVLDEVDAPLDDANVGKFNNIIKQFSENSQFIIVTHKKETMVHVEAIYGVTMAEPGISKVVPVEFASLN